MLDSTLFISGERTKLTVPGILEGLQEEFGDVMLAASIMTAWELLHGVWRAFHPAVRVRRREFVEEALERVPFHPFDLTAARIAAEVDAHLRGQGKLIASADLIIGSTALHLDYTLVTANLRHFKSIPSLEVVKFDFDKD
ncbi:MAG: PIN domain-containing protein [Acidobacteriota bacterium]